MRRWSELRNWDWAAPWTAALGLLTLLVMFGLELWDFRGTVIDWARRDLKSRAELAAHTLEEPLRTSDFRRLHGFGDECAAEGVRLTVFSPQGGVFFDTMRPGSAEPATLFAECPCVGHRIRLGLSYGRVLAPVFRAWRGLALAGALGGFAVLIAFFFAFRQRVRMRELARQEQFQRDFIADVSHEIKTPLTGILGAVELMEAELERPAAPDASPATRSRLLTMIGSEARRLNGLVQSILDLARLERPQLTLEFSDVDLVALTEDVCAALRIEADRRGVNLRVEHPKAAALTGRVDVRLFSEALTNLVANAIRHSGAPEVVVSLASRHQSVELVVEDHGVGIPPEHREHVFERFHRVDVSRTAASGGAGLGLAIVREIVRRHGGTVTLEPAQPSGCRFVIVLGALTCNS